VIQSVENPPNRETAPTDADLGRQLASLLHALTVGKSWDDYRWPNALWRWLDDPTLTAMAFDLARTLDGAAVATLAIDPEH